MANSEEKNSKAVASNSDMVLPSNQPRQNGQYQHRKTADLVYRAKSRHRTDIPPEAWTKWNYYFSDICERSFKISDGIPRLDGKTLSLHDFVEKYELKSKPVIIGGLTSEWEAGRVWTVENFKRDFRNASLKVGEDDSGRRIKMTMKYFLDYMENNRDDSPLYMFDSSVSDRTDTNEISKHWRLPSLFPFDLHCIIGEERRPPHKWFCIGPKNSGTTVHIDPIGTAAWNALLVGHKRWVLFPPEVAKSIVKGKQFMAKGDDNEAIMWFDKILPKIRQKYPDVPVYEIIQKPGDIIFVPPLWWHAVLNLDDTIGCTQNFVSYSNFELAWREMRFHRPRLAVSWIGRLKRFFPELHFIARTLDRKDKWKISNGKYKMILDNGGLESPKDSSSSDSSTSSESSDDDIELNEIERRCKEMKDLYDKELKNVPFFPIATEDLFS